MKNQFKKVIAIAAAAALTMTQFAALSHTACAADETDVQDTPALTGETVAETEETTETEETPKADETTETEGITDPTEGITDPTEEITDPSEVTTDPTEETTDPSEETSEPTEETTEPTEDSSEETTEDVSDAQDIPDFSYLGAVGTLSEEQTVMIASSIYNALKNHETKVEFDTVNYERIQRERDIEALRCIFYTILYGTRYGVLVDLGFSYSYTMPANAPHYITSMTINYSVPDMMYEDAFTDAQQKLDAILQGVDAEWSTPEKALYLHDYFAVNFNYDYAGLANAVGGDPCYTAYGLLVENVAVCQGYAWLYNILLNDLGIESYVVTSDENDHAWNAVVLDGMYYNIDCTFDDGSQVVGKQLGLAGQVSHESFMKSHTAMLSSGHTCNEYDWVLSTGRTVWTVDDTGSHVVDVPTDNKYNSGFWATTHSAIYPMLGGWLVKEPDPFNFNAASYNLYTYDFESNSSEWIAPIAGESGEWYAGLDRTRRYSDNYSVCSVKDDVIYFTTNSGVMAAIRDEDGGQYDYTTVTLFTLDEAQAEKGFVYGMRISGDTMYFQVTSDLRTAPVEYKYSLADVIDTINAALRAEEVTSVTGDLNGDSDIDIIDVISMQRYLAGTDTIEDLDIRRRADVVEDGVLDVFDLAMLKKMVLSQKQM